MKLQNNQLLLSRKLFSLLGVQFFIRLLERRFIKNYKLGWNTICFIYDNSTKFSSHTKTQRHKKWLSILNQNKSNYYVENIKHVELIDNQKLIISRLEKQLQTKNLTIDILTEELSNLKLKTNNHTNTYLDLLDIN